MITSLFGGMDYYREQSIFSRLNSFITIDFGSENDPLGTQTPVSQNSGDVLSLSGAGPVSSQPVLHNELIASINRVLSSQGQSAIESLKPEDYTPESVSGNILGFVGQALANAKNQGASPEELEALYEQAREGIEKGFSEARNILQGMGALIDSVDAELVSTYSLIQKGLAEIKNSLFPQQAVELVDNIPEETATETSPVSNTPGFYSEQTFSADFSSSKSLSFQIQTNDGDVVTLNFDSLLNARRFAARINDGNTTTSLNESSLSSSSNFSFTIEGDLDKGEIQSIRHLINKIDHLSDKFFDGKVQNALRRVSKLELDTSELAAFSLNMESTQSKQVTSTYKAIGELGTEDATIDTTFADELAAAGDFISDLRETRLMPELDDLFKSPMEAFDELFEGAVALNPAHDDSVDEIEDYSGIPLNDFISELTGASEEREDSNIEDVVEEDHLAA